MDSLNFNPVMPWSFGIQMVALNFQMCDQPMQLNHGMFTRYRNNFAVGVCDTAYIIYRGDLAHMEYYLF